MRNKTLILVISTFLGVSFAGYILYEQKGSLRITDFLVLGVTLAFGLSLTFFMTKQNVK